MQERLCTSHFIGIIKLLSSRKRKAVDEPCINRHSNFYLFETVRLSYLRVYLLSPQSTTYESWQWKCDSDNGIQIKA